ncbi:HIT family protein [Microlunatus parietis]|uniref:Histidine triad (HIT) family protein n=1 Tax=Microlunatus parietis TaxID=682979 RepID=A0A7Y9LCA9_9ACTN|nr:HIT family protein [Microlunatus parietis]NYE72647.1 histidine triad (HIT) family protein [Microlunatus parietis]
MDELTGYRGTDFYCDVALRRTGELDVVAETDQVLAFRHTRPYWRDHVVVIPKVHLASLITVTEADEPVLRELFAVVRRVAAELTADRGAARVLTNLGDYQDSKHLHVHVSSGPVLR